jgi:hypothetical protein
MPSMRNLTTLYLIAMLLVSLVITSDVCVKYPPPNNYNLIGTWDYHGFEVNRTDSNTNPPTYTSFDTTFAKHSQYSYQFKTNDTLIYNDYSIQPNLIKYGTYLVISDSTTAIKRVVLSFPPNNPDTLFFGGRQPSNSFSFWSITDSSHVNTLRFQFYLSY